MQVDVGNLPRGIHVRRMCFHPQRPIIVLVRASDLQGAWHARMAPRPCACGPGASQHAASCRALCARLPTRPTPQAAQNYVGAYDMLSGARLGREEFRTPAVKLMFTPDGAQLLLATQVGRGGPGERGVGGG